MGFGLVRYSARASITLDQLAEQGSGLNQREGGAGEENRDRDKRSRLISVGECRSIERVDDKGGMDDSREEGKKRLWKLPDMINFAH